MPSVRRCCGLALRRRKLTLLVVLQFLCAVRCFLSSPLSRTKCGTRALANMKASINIATSVDGMIADKDGGVDWLNSQPQIEGEDHGFQAFLDSTDVIIMGRHTFEKVVSFGEEAWAYGNKPLVVMSGRFVELPKYLSKTASSSSLRPKQLIENLQAKGFQHAYVDGGYTIRQFLKEGLVQRLILTTIPVVLGDGIRLFSDQGPLDLEFVESKSWSNGMVQSVYQVRNKEV